MQALYLDGSAKLVSDYPEPRRHPGEALLCLRVAGICDTDLQLTRGYMQFRGVLGHEMVADVLDADDADWIGQRVVGDINASCGICPQCLDDDAHHCSARTVLGISGRDGALAERFTLPQRCLVAVPQHVPDECAVFAEPLAAALHVLDEVDPEYVASATVIGDGKLGLFIAMVLAKARILVTLVGHHREKLELVTPFGIRTLLESELPADEPLAPLVVEASGSEAGLSMALGRVAPRGKLVLKTTTAGKVTLDLAPLVVNEIAIVGSRCGDIAVAVDWLARGHIDPRPFIAARYPLAQAEEALQHAAMRNVLKVLVTGA